MPSHALSAIDGWRVDVKAYCSNPPPMTRQPDPPLSPPPAHGGQVSDLPVSSPYFSRYNSFSRSQASSEGIPASAMY